MEAFAIQLAWVALWSPAIVLGTGLLQLRKRSPSQRLWMVQLAFAMGMQLIGSWLSAQHHSNLALFHVHILVEFSCYVGIFYLGRMMGSRKAIPIALIAAFTTFWGINALWGEGMQAVPTYALSVESLLLIGLAIGYFVRTFIDSRIAHLEREFLFWFSIGILILFLGNILISLFLGAITAREDVYFHIWTIRSSLIILTNLVFVIAMSCKDQPTKS